jgi:membrane protein YdbS with pleckstrin-like domain
MHGVHMLDSVDPVNRTPPASGETTRTGSAPWQGGAMAMPPPDERNAPAPPLREPVNLVSRRAVTYWTVRAAYGWLLLLVGQAVWFWLDNSHRDLRVVALMVTVLVAAGHLVVMPRWRYRVHRWEVSPLAVYTQAGWLNQERRIAPLSRIQTVDSQRGPLEQLFGLANVTVTTASAAGPLHIKGLDNATAQRLVRELTTVTAAAEGDAT